MVESIMVDADFCIKLGSSEKYKFLLEILPTLARKIYIHSEVHQEVKYPFSAVAQLGELIKTGTVEIVDEASLDLNDMYVYQSAYRVLESVMTDPRYPNKNRGEISSLAWAKTKGIKFFATDERTLQPIINAVLNIGIDDIYCIRIEDLVLMARNGIFKIERKIAKVLWVVAGKEKEIFDQTIWPIN